MIYFIYVLLALAVIFLSVKAADYVDLLDKKTNLGGAFIGGVILAAVTSLPELFTSISSVVMLKKPELAIGNILGSNLFNVSILAILILIGAKSFKRAKISNSNYKTLAATAIIYIILSLGLIVNLDFHIATISILSIVIAITYIFAIKSMATDSSVEEDNIDDSPLTLNQVIVRFAVTSVALVASSILITFVTDEIAIKLNLGASVAGALFLGIATSLPEVTSCIALVRVKNYNMAVGNIVGSNLFNFFMLIIADLLFLKGTIYIFTDYRSVLLLLFGLLNAVILLILLRLQKAKQNTKTIVYQIGGFIMVLGYISYLILSI